MFFVLATPFTGKTNQAPSRQSESRLRQIAPLLDTRRGSSWCSGSSKGTGALPRPCPSSLPPPCLASTPLHQYEMFLVVHVASLPLGRRFSCWSCLRNGVVLAYVGRNQQPKHLENLADSCFPTEADSATVIAFVVATFTDKTDRAPPETNRAPDETNRAPFETNCAPSGKQIAPLMRRIAPLLTRVEPIWSTPLPFCSVVRTQFIQLWPGSFLSKPHTLNSKP